MGTYLQNKDHSVAFTVYPLLATLVAVYRLPRTVSGKRFTVNVTLFI